MKRFRVIVAVTATMLFWLVLGTSAQDLGIFEKIADWSGQGAYKEPGSVEVTGSGTSAVYTISGNGNGIWGSQDEGFFVYKELAGSWSLRGRVQWVDNDGNDFAKMGLMIREKADSPGSRHYWIDLIGLNFGARTYADWRSTEGAWNLIEIKSPSGGPVGDIGGGLWLRVTRIAERDLLFSEYSEDGETWHLAHSMTMELPETVAYGLAITNSQDNQGLAIGTVTGAAIEEPAAIANRSFDTGFFTEGTAVTVTIEIFNPASTDREVTALETIPEQWTASEISHNGSLSANLITWNITVPPGTTVLTYKATAPALPKEGRAIWTGTVGQRSIAGTTLLAFLKPGAGDFQFSIDIIPPRDRTHLDGQIAYDAATNEYEIVGNGASFDDRKKDELYYVFREIKGSWRIEAELEWIERPRASYQIGFMCRESLDVGSKMVTTTYLGPSAIFTNYRATTDGNRDLFGFEKTLPGSLQGAPMLCRLTRLARANQFIAEWYNPEAEKWMSAASVSVEMPEEVLLGLMASTYNDNSSLAVGCIRDVKITPMPFAVWRSLSTGNVPPGGSLDVELIVYGEADPPPDFTIVDRYPPGWTVSNLKAGTGDANDDGSGTITWKANDIVGVVTLTYTLIAPANASGTVSISGTYDDGAGFAGGIGRDEVLVLQLPPTTGPREITVDLPDLPEGAKPLEMVLILAGKFMMGSPPDEPGRNSTEDPQHEVTLTKPFYLGKYEVTLAQWDAVRGTDLSSRLGTPNHPVNRVTWQVCQTFIDKLNSMGLGSFRFPTEAEWEYACRAGTTTRFSFGDVLDISNEGYHEVADQHMWWMGNNTYGSNVYGPKEVGLKLPNPWGLYDMHGNIYEWCMDGWTYSYPSGSQIDPIAPRSGLFCVIRGGCWDLGAVLTCRSAARGCGFWNREPSDWIGLRLARDVDAETAVGDWPLH